MEIQTKYHGSLSVEQENLLTFPQGIPGFQDEKEFTLLPFPGNDWFHILQSTVTPELGFVATEPFSFFPDYEFELDEASIETLRHPEGKDLKILSILTIREPLDRSTANLQAPVIINPAQQLGKQVILTGTDYQTQHPIFNQTERKRG